MATQTLRYCTQTKLDCGCVPFDVVLCVPASIVAPSACPEPSEEDQETPAKDYLDATVTAVDADTIPHSCGSCTRSYVYTISYDDTQLTEGEELISENISGIVCKNCLTDWIENRIGNEAYIRTEEDSSQTFVSQHGCEYPIVNESVGFISAVDDTDTVDLTVTDGELTAAVVEDPNPQSWFDAGADGCVVIPRINDTSSVNMTLAGDGTLSADVTVDPNPLNNLSIETDGLYAETLISANAGNIITLEADGIFASAAVNSVDDTNTLDLTLSSGEVTGNVRISAAPGNGIIAQGDGIYYTPDVNDSTSVNMTNAGGVISADVTVDPNPGNILTSETDGLRVAYNDTLSITLSQNGSSELEADLIVDPDPNNALTVTADGAFVPFGAHGFGGGPTATPAFTSDTGVTVTPAAYDPLTESNVLQVYYTTDNASNVFAHYTYNFELTLGVGADPEEIIMVLPFTTSIESIATIGIPDFVECQNDPGVVAIGSARVVAAQPTQLRVRFDAVSGGGTFTAAGTNYIRGKGFLKVV